MTKTSKKQDKKIKEIIDEFDFEKVHKVMTFLDWKWGFGNGFRVPSVGELKDRAVSLLKDCSRKDVRSARTGGFMAEYYNKELSLVFYIDYQSVSAKNFKNKAKPKNESKADSLAWVD